MIFVKIILFILALLGISFCLGKVLLQALNKGFDLPGRITSKLFTGFVVFWLSGLIVGSIAGYIGLSTELSAMIWIVFLLIIVILSTLVGRGGIKENHLTEKMNKGQMIFHLCLAAMVLIQILVVIYYRYEQVEASRNLWIATRVYEDGRLFKSFGMMNVWGLISWIFKTHPLTVIYMIIPAGLLMLYYIGYYEVLMVMSGGNRKESVGAVFVISLLQIWGYQSDKLIPISMLLSWYSLGCLIVHSLLPFIFFLLMGYRKRHPQKAREREEFNLAEDNEDYQEEWDMKKHKIINARNLAIAWGLLAVMLIAFVYILNNKINTLHDSTVNMQADLNKRCAVYEFTPSGSGVEGYLLKGTDGSLTMIGGASSKTGEELYDFLQGFGDSLSNWYLYGIEEEDAGGYIYCVSEKGLKVDNVYILDRTRLDELMK